MRSTGTSLPVLYKNASTMDSTPHCNVYTILFAASLVILDLVSPGHQLEEVPFRSTPASQTGGYCDVGGLVSVSQLKINIDTKPEVPSSDRTNSNTGSLQF